MSLNAFKKILLVLLVGATAIAGAEFVFAATSLPQPVKIGLPFEGKDAPTTIGKIIKQGIMFVGIFAVMALTYAGILMMLSYGDESKVKSAKGIIQYALIGIVLSGAAYAIIEAINALKLN